MKKNVKRIFALALVLALCLGCVVVAQAAEEYINEIEDVAVKEGYTVSFGKEAVEGAYSNIEKFTISFSGVEGTEYAVLLLSGENNSVPVNGNIRYIDQKSGAATMEFTVYPDDLTVPGKYALHIATGSEYIEDVVTFSVAEPPYTLGDVDGSGKIDSYDASLILQYKADMLAEDAVFIEAAADTDRDGSISTYDASLILQYIADMIDEF